MLFTIKSKIGKPIIIGLFIISLSTAILLNLPLVNEESHKYNKETGQKLHSSQAHNFTSKFTYDLTNIQHVKNLEFSLNTPKQIQMHGEFIFVSYQSSSLAIFNISNPNSPWLCSTYNLGFPIVKFFIDGNVMYVASQTTFQILNISDIGSILSMKTYYGFSNILDFCIQGDTLYLLESDAGITYLRIYTNRSWNSAEAVGQYPLGSEDYVEMVKVHNHIILGSNTGTIISINVLDPSNPLFFDSKTYGSSIRKIRIYGNTLYFADLYNFHALDPYNFADRALYSIGGIRDFLLETNLGYFALNTGAIKIINITRADRYEAIVDLYVGDSVKNILLYDNYLMFTTPIKLYSVQVATEIIPEQMLLEHPGDTYQVRIFGEYVFIATNSELRIFNLRNNSFSYFYNYLSQGVRDVYLNGQYLYVLYYADILRILDFSDPYSMSLLNTTSLGPYTTHSMTCAHGYLFISRLGQGVTIVNITNPVSAEIIANIPTTSSSYSSIVLNNMLYIANLDYISVVNITDIANPVEIVTIPMAMVFSLEVSYPYLYAGTQSGLEIYNICETIPRFITQYNIVGLNSMSVKKSGDLLYCARGTGGLEVMNVSDPRIKNSFHENNYLTALSVDTTHNKAVLSRNTNGWEILKIRNTAVDILQGKYFIETLWSGNTNSTTGDNDKTPDDGSSNNNPFSGLNFTEILPYTLPPLGIVIVIYLIVKIRGSKGPKAKKLKAMTSASLDSGKKSTTDDFFDSDF